jgi:hypothetical protein
VFTATRGSTCCNWCCQTSVAGDSQAAAAEKIGSKAGTESSATAIAAAYRGVGPGMPQR